MKASIKPTAILFVLLVASLELKAADTVKSITNLSENEFELPEQAGRAKVRIRDNSANFGLPYAVDLSAICGNGAKPNVRSLGVCDVKPGSVKLSPDGKAITIQVRETNAEAYNLKTQTASAEELMTLEPGCSDQATTLRLTIADLCK